MSEKIIQSLIEGARELGVTLSQLSAQQLLDFLHLLQKWNRTYNLTAIHSLDKMLAYHLLDSLAVAPFVTGRVILDVGTGAGLPGMPLAILFSEKKFVLLDSVGKKIRFLQQAILQLHIKNVTLVENRVEKFNTEFNFDVIISRAVGRIAEIIKASQHLLNPHGEWIFMKGSYPQKEIDQLRIINCTHTIDVRQIHIPGIDAVRHLVIVTNKEG